MRDVLFLRTLLGLRVSGILVNGNVVQDARIILYFSSKNEFPEILYYVSLLNNVCFYLCTNTVFL